jgi:hypothetical protein
MLRSLAADAVATAGEGIRHQARQSECFMHGDQDGEPWRSVFRDIEVIRCDHLGVAYVVEMVLVAGSADMQYRSHHIHFVRDGRREVHALAEDLTQDSIDRVWNRAVLAMERGEAPNYHQAHFHRPSW